MSSNERLYVYVVPGPHMEDVPVVDPNHRERIVGINNGSEIMWADQSPVSRLGNGKYDRADADEVTLPGDMQFRQRLLEFFERYIARKFDKDNPFNCHLFARWMIGEPTNGTFSLEGPTAIVGDGQLAQAFLRLGQRGVMGWQYRGADVVNHSVIGLGEELNRCIQVMGFGGHLALSTYGYALNYYVPQIAIDDHTRRAGVYIETDNSARRRSSSLPARLAKIIWGA